jgi:[NiFe] hydrogenase assembly HybE family chaperone
MTASMTEAGNPGPRLEAVFRAIAATRMAGVPIVNPALAVEAVGFRIHDGRWMGVLITPWFMNLIALPAAADDWAGQPSGTPRRLTLPVGEVKFLHAHEDALGPYLSHSLFSPMGQFADPPAARAVADEVLQRLFDPAWAELSLKDAAAVEPASGLEKPLSRRGFLTALLPRDK